MLSWDLRFINCIKTNKLFLESKKLLKSLLFYIDYAKTVKKKQIFFIFEEKKSFDVINKSAHKSVKKGYACKLFHVSQFSILENFFFLFPSVVSVSFNQKKIVEIIIIYFVLIMLNSKTDFFYFWREEKKSFNVINKSQLNAKSHVSQFLIFKDVC